MVQFANTDSNLIGYSGLSDIMANSIQLCSLLIYVYQVPKGQTSPKSEHWGHVLQSGLLFSMGWHNGAICS